MARQGAPAAYVPRGESFVVSLAGVTETDLCAPHSGYFDLENIIIGGGGLATTVQFRDQRGETVYFPIPVAAGEGKQFFPPNRIEQRRRGQGWTVQLSIATNVTVMVQGREFV